MTRILIALGLALAIAAQAQAQDYAALLRATLDRPPEELDFVALRRAFAASPDYRGASSVVGMTRYGHAVDPAAVQAAAWRELPLIESHHQLAFLYGLGGPEQAPLKALHERIEAEIVADVLAAVRVGADGRPTYQALAEGEEALLLRALGPGWSEPARTLRGDGGALDVFATAQGPIAFELPAQAVR